MYLGQVDPLITSARQTVARSAQSLVPRYDNGGIDWHALSAMTGTLLALVTVWQIMRMEKRRRS